MKKNWDELTIGDHLKIRSIGELQLASDEEKNLRVGALLAEVDYNDLLLKPLDDVRDIMDNTQFLLEKPVPVKARKKYEINGRTYRLFKDPGEMTVAQFIDFQQIYREGFDKLPVELLSIFLIPEGHVYNDGYDRQEQMDDMLSLSITEALGIADFFIGRCHRSINRMMMFSRLMMKWRTLVAPKDEKDIMKVLERQLTQMGKELERLYGLIQ